MPTEARIFDIALEQFPFLSGLDDRAHDRFMTEAVPLSFEYDKYFCMPGDKCSVLPLVLEGAARVYHVSETGREVTLYRLSSGESCILTASCILSEDEFPAFAQVESDVLGVGLPSTLVIDWMNEYAECRKFLFGLMTKRLTSIISVVEEVAFQRVDHRIAKYILNASGVSNKVVEQTHGGIASELGSSREVISRILGDFERRGLVSLSRGKISVLDVQKLIDISAS